MVSILILGILGNILVASCLELNIDDVIFISAVYEHFKFYSGLVVVNDIADQISESVSKEAEYGVCFVFLEDSQGFLKSIHAQNQTVFITTTWLIMLGKELRAESTDLGVMFGYNSNVNIVIEHSNKLEMKEI